MFWSSGRPPLLLFLLLLGGNFFLRLSRRLFPCGNAAEQHPSSSAIHSRERLHSRFFTLSNSLTASLTVCGPSAVAMGGRF